MNSINDRRLNELSRRIARLDEEAAGDTHRAIAARAQLERELRAYYMVSEVIRRGDARRVAA